MFPILKDSLLLLNAEEFENFNSDNRIYAISLAWELIIDIPNSLKNI